MQADIRGTHSVPVEVVSVIAIVTNPNVGINEASVVDQLVRPPGTRREDSTRGVQEPVPVVVCLGNAHDARQQRLTPYKDNENTCKKEAVREGVSNP